MFLLSNSTQEHVNETDEPKAEDGSALVLGTEKVDGESCRTF